MALSAACKVYIAFSDGPLVASPTWTEVTAYVRSVRTSRGRSNELDDFSAGTCTVVLDNRARRFDPDYSAGPYFGDLLPRRQIKVEAVHAATTYPVFRGLVQSWVQGWPVTGRDATCTVQATDLFGLLATWDLPQTAHETYARSLTPAAYWPLDDSDAAVAAEIIAASNGYYGGSRTAVDEFGVTAGASQVVSAVGSLGSHFAAAAPIPSPTAASSSTVTAVMRVRGGSQQATAAEFTVDAGAWYLEAASTGTTAYVAVSGPHVLSATASPVTDDRIHHLAAVRSGTTIRLYVDGVEAATATNASATGNQTASRVTLGKALANSYNDFTIANAVVWPTTALTAGQVAILADAALTGWVNQRADQRISRVLDLLGVPSALYSIQTASSSVGAFEGGTDALSYLQAVTRSDQGRLYVSRAGVITFEAKTDDMGASSAATFADDSTANAVRYTGFELELDDRLIYNEVTVAGVGDAAFTARNATSISTYSRRGLTRDTGLPTAAACRDVAQATAARYAAPSTRGRSWTVSPERFVIGSTSTRAYATVLGRELGDIVTVKRTPPTGSAISKTVQVTSIAHEIDLPAGQWSVTFTGAPAYTSSSFRWGTSNWGGTDGWS